MVLGDAIQGFGRFDCHQSGELGVFPQSSSQLSEGRLNF
jgi:hypothetical protein